MSLLAIDLGGTKLAMAQFDDDGTILQKANIPLAGRKGQEVGSLVADNMRSVIESSHPEHVVHSVGVSVPGISRIKTGTVWAPNISGWDDYPLLTQLKTVCGDIPVTIDSDRACSILGEIWQGNANGCNDAIFLAVGTGIGAGIVANGNILRGSHDISGAVGWMALTRPFLDEYVNYGCFEYHASGDGIARVARNLLSQHEEYAGNLRNLNPQQISSHDVFSAYDSGDVIAKQVFDICIGYWGMAIANFVSIFNPEKILLGGGVFGPAVQFIPAIKTEALKWAQPISIHQVSIEASALGSDAALYGAGYLALKAIHHD